MYTQATALQGEDGPFWIQPERDKLAKGTELRNPALHPHAYRLQLLNKNLGLLLALFIRLTIPSVQLLKRCFLYFDDPS